MEHLSARMLERYSHIRMQAKRETILAVEARTAASEGRTVESHVKQSSQHAGFAKEITAAIKGLNLLFASLGA
ncbi:MAG TPA: hypothetical protein VH639_10580 [Bryobacteraceae bacterium]|jgi:hypothetical protein